EADEGGAEIAPVEVDHDRGEHRRHHGGHQHGYPDIRENPDTGTTAATAEPAAAPAAHPARPARNARGTPVSAAPPPSRPTSTSRAIPATVRPMEVPSASAGTTRGLGTNGTISRSVTITSSHPAPTAWAAARLRPRAYRTRERLADRPYPMSAGAKAASATA